MASEKIGPCAQAVVTRHHPGPCITFNIRDALSVCDRLEDRANTTLDPKQQADMRIAAALIRELWRRGFHNSDLVRIAF